MASWPILSVITFLPLVGALFIVVLRGDDESVKRNARWVALWTTIVTFAVSLVLVWRFDAVLGRIPVRREDRAGCRGYANYTHGRRRHLAAAS